MQKIIFSFSSLILFSIFGFCSVLLAQEATSQPLDKNLTPLPPVDLVGSLYTMFKGLAICIIFLMLVIWLLKKLKSPIITGQGRKLKIVERLPVSTRASLLLVEVNNKQILVGVSADRVSLISDFIHTDSLEDLTVDNIVTKETAAEKTGGQGE